MPWGRLDDSLYDHPKLDELGDDRLAGVGLWAVAISWSNRRLTDGHIPRSRVPMLGGTIELADQLVRVGLFDPDEGGYLVHDFLHFNDSRSDVESRRASDAERKRRQRGLHTGVTPGLQPDGAVDSGTDSGRDSAGDSRAPARSPASRPDPARPGPSSTTPKPPPSGGLRANGTNPRAIAEAITQEELEASQARRARRTQRRLASYRGAITDVQRAEMDARDAPLTDIPDWSDHAAKLEADRKPAVDVL